MRAVGHVGAEQHDAALTAAADLLTQRSAEILEANAADLASAAAGGMEAGPLDRLRLSEARLAGMAQGLRDVAGLADPVGEVLEGSTRPNGLVIERVRVPLGVVAVIYENRPNVTSDAAGICLKSGNVALLRGSASALRSNVAIADVANRAKIGKFKVDDFGGGTFTVDNTGYLGTNLVMPILNVPEVGIVTMEAITKRPVVVSTPDGDVLAIRPVMNMVLGVDHRANDGAGGAALLRDIKAWLESVGPDTPIY